MRASLRLAIPAGVLCMVSLLASSLAAQTKSAPTAGAPARTKSTAPAKAPARSADPGVTLPSGLQYWDLKVGTGTEAARGNWVRVHYTGTLTNGRKFDSSLDRNEPLDFKIGAGQVIKGWEEGVVGMKVGGKRRLRIPPALAYGNQSPGAGIPRNSTLVFVIELLRVE